MKRHELTIVVILAIFLTCPVHANEDMALELSDLIEQARLYNPEILVAAARYEVARSRVSGFRYLMDPMLGIEFAGNMRMYSISQRIPFPTKLGTLSKFAKTEAQEYENEYRQKEQEIINKVKKNYAQLFFIHKKIGTLDESIAFLTQLFQIASQHYALGHVPQVDVLRAQVELAKLENELFTLQDEKTVIKAKLNILLNRKPDEKLGIRQGMNIPSLTMEEQELYEIAKEHHPGLKAFTVRVEKARVMRSYARQSYLPDFMFKFTQQEMDYNLTDQKFMFGFTVPLWFWGKQNEMVREMDAHIKMAEAYYKHMENMVLLSVKEAMVMVDKNRRTVTLYENSIIPQAEASLNAALVAYEVNQTDFSSLLETEQMLVQLELEYYRAQADFFIAIANLEEAVGTDIENNED